MDIAFIDFWPGFDPNNNFLLHALREVKEDVHVISPHKADILFFSVFGDSNKHYSFYKKIAYTGENVAHSKLPDHDYALSFSPTNDNNFRLPLWVWYIDWWNKKTYTNPKHLVPKEWLTPATNPYYKNVHDRRKFCATIFSNPVITRFEAIHNISEIARVDNYGKYGNKLPQGEQAKYDLLSQYKFNLCFENSLSEGYVTEKLFQAFVAGTMPIYWGDDFALQDFTAPFIKHEDWGSTIHQVRNAMTMDNPILMDEPFINESIFHDFLSHLSIIT